MRINHKLYGSFHHTIKYESIHFRFIVLNNDSISDSYFLSISIAQDNTSSGTSSSRWVAIISSGTALTSVNKEV